MRTTLNLDDVLVRDANVLVYAHRKDRDFDRFPGFRPGRL